MTGLPLFDWTPPTRILLFPVHRRVGRIRRVATSLLSKKSDRTAALEWERTMSAMAKQLAAVGLSEYATEQYLADFREAVELEMQRQAYVSRQSGGAA